MKRFFKLLIIVFMVSLVSFEANASPLTHQDVGINHATVLQTDNFSVVTVNRMFDVNIIEVYPVFDVSITSVKINRYFVKELKTDISDAERGGLLILYSQYMWEQSEITLESSYLPKIIAIYNEHGKKTKRKQSHIRYKQIVHYSLTGYSIWS